MSLKSKLTITLFVGVILVVFHISFDNFLLLISGMGLLLYTFFAVRKGDYRQYVAADRKPLLLIPLAVCLLAAVFGFIIFKNPLAAIGVSLAVFGLYAVLTGRLLLNFSGYRVFEGAFARIPAMVLLVFGGFIAYSFMIMPARVVYQTPDGSWNGKYSFPAGEVSGCISSHEITVVALTDARRLEYGQYSVRVASMVDCHSDTVAGVPLYDDIDGYAAGEGNLLFIWDQAERDTLFVLERVDNKVALKQTGRRL